MVQYGWTALHRSAEYGSQEGVALLIRHGADVGSTTAVRGVRVLIWHSCTEITYRQSLSIFMVRPAGLLCMRPLQGGTWLVSPCFWTMELIQMQPQR